MELFDSLDHRGKMEAVFKAVFLADRFTDKHYVRLFYFDDLYVGVFLEDRSHLINNFRSFDHTMFLLPYVDELKRAV